MVNALSVRLEGNAYRELKQCAKRNGRSLNQEIVFAVDAWCKSQRTTEEILVGMRPQKGVKKH